MLAFAMSAKIAQLARPHAPEGAPAAESQAKTDPAEACARPVNEQLRKSCAEYQEATRIMRGERGFAPLLGIHTFANFHLHPTGGGPLVHDSIREPLCLDCVCRADEGPYSVIGFSGDHKMVLMERMSDRDAAGVCDRGTRFFIPVEWLKPSNQKVSQK